LEKAAEEAGLIKSPAAVYPMYFMSPGPDQAQKMSQGYPIQTSYHPQHSMSAPSIQGMIPQGYP
jgi:hypothetical protein